MNAALGHLLIAAQPLLTISGPRSGLILTCTDVHLLENLLFLSVKISCKGTAVSEWVCMRWIVVGQQTALQITWLCDGPLPALGMGIQIFLWRAHIPQNGTAECTRTLQYCNSWQHECTIHLTMSALCSRKVRQLWQSAGCQLCPWFRPVVFCARC